ncbi:poly(A) polymerase [Kitasatospora sp. NBC_00315]|uniref:poly(A) polymerase n=1 Tax=Kitasatospora sp. NBC_00315 TaxID=2975963 RepID=UPI0032436001
MRTSEQIYHRVCWDQRFDAARFVLGVGRRGAGTARVPLPAFVPGGDIPWHRVLFVEADGELVWDRATGLDRLDATRAGRAGRPRRLRAPFFTPSTPHAWDGSAWSPGAGADRPAPASLRLLTWNTLWDRYDSDRIDTAGRRPLLLAALARADADVIALQEVEADLLDLLLAAPWVRAGYTLGTDPAGTEVEDTGLLMLSRLPVHEAGRHALGPHKAVTAVTLAGATAPLVVAATHLSSDHTDNGAARRRQELAVLAEGLARVDGELVLMGDFNDSDDGPQGPAATLGLRDAWTDVHGPGDRTPTFDPGTNPLAAVSSLSGRASRLDRILLRTGGSHPATAALLGDSPTPAGQYASDHYGVLAELHPGPAGAEDRSAEALDLAPTARTALAWLPPEELRPAVQAVRREHDPQIHRRPPHVDLLFGFVPESDFERAAPLLSAAVAGTAAFTARLDGIRSFEHRDGATVRLDPPAGGAEPWTELHRALLGRFPRCQGRAEEFTPHLSLGRTAASGPVTGPAAADRAVWPRATSALVGELVLLSRRGDEPMRPRATLRLGTGELRWTPEPPAADLLAAEGPLGQGGSLAVEDSPVVGDSPVGRARAADDRREGTARSVFRRVSEALEEGFVHLVGSRRTGGALAGADLDLVAALPGTVDLTDVQGRLAAALPGATGLRRVTGARVPGLRFRLDGLDVDLVVVATGPVDPAAAVARRAGIGEAAAVALSAVSDAEALAAEGGEEHARLAARVKAWARARGLDSAPFGGLPGLAWSVLAARTAREAPGATGQELLRHFFASWAAWDWREPVALADGPSTRPPVAPESVRSSVTVLTPTAPVRSCTDQVGPGGLDLLVQELYRAWELLEAAASDGGDPWPELLSPPPLHRRHAAWAVLSVEAARSEEFEETRGRVRGRLRALLAALAQAGAADAHAWPRPFESGPVSARYAIGLGRTPPDAAALAAIAGRWGRGLPGVGLTRAACGEVPTLR